MFVEILILIVGFFYLSCKDVKYRQKIKECNDKGMNVKTDRELENQLFLDYCCEYQSGNNKNVPEKYRGYFGHNSKAMYDYFMTLAARDVWKKGYRPYLYSIMPKDGWDALESYRNKYDKYVEQYNKSKVKV